MASKISEHNEDKIYFALIIQNKISIIMSWHCHRATVSMLVLGQLPYAFSYAFASIPALFHYTNTNGKDVAAHHASIDAGSDLIWNFREIVRLFPLKISWTDTEIPRLKSLRAFVALKDSFIQMQSPMPIQLMASEKRSIALLIITFEWTNIHANVVVIRAQHMMIQFIESSELFAASRTQMALLPYVFVVNMAA